MPAQCKGTTRSGTRCRNLAVGSQGFCRTHHPDPIQRPSTGSNFEEKVVKVLRLLGYKVERNVTLNGCQIDIYAEYRTGIIPLRLLVECKDYGPDKDVGIEEINKAVGVLSPARGKAVDKGLFVTTYGFSRHAKEYAREAGIECVTFADLSTQLVDFGGYIDRLISEFEKSPLSKYYINVAGTEVEEYETLNPADYIRPADNLVNQHLRTGQGKLALLGNFGTGKTTFCRKYAYDLATQYKVDSTGRIPVLINLSDYDRKQDIQEVITSTLQYEFGVRVDPALCQELQRLGRFVLLFDGFDEMASQADAETVRGNLREINKVSRIPENRFLLTCRTHFFRDRVQAEVLGDFNVIFLPEWGEIELKEFLQKRFGNDWDVQLDRIRGTHNLQELAQTPLFLEMIVETLPKLGDQVRRIELYEVYTNKWIKKQTGHRGARLSEEERRQFVSDLAIKLYTDGIFSCHHSKFASLIRERFQVDDPAAIDYLQNDIRTCTFLTRDANGNYGFRHKSFMEFFVAQRLASDIYNATSANLSIRQLQIEIADFLVEILAVKPPEETLKGWIQTVDLILRENVLLLLTRLGVNLSDAVLQGHTTLDTETKLTARFVQGDKKALASLYEELRDRLVAYATSWVDHWKAEDIVQSTFLQILTGARKLEQVTNIQPYLTAMVRSAVFFELRQKAEEKFVSIDDLEMDNLYPTGVLPWAEAEEILNFKNLEIDLNYALEQLSELDRAIILQWERGDERMLAQRFGVSFVSLRVRRQRILMRLREYLKQKAP